MSFSAITGNVMAAGVISATLDVAEVAAATSAEQTFTVPGLRVGDFVFVNVPSTINDGLGVAGARVFATDTLALRFVNATAGALNPASATYSVLVVRPGSPTLPTGFAP